MATQRGAHRKLTHEQFLERLHNKHGDAYIALSEYVKTTEKVLFRHNENECGHEFQMRPNDILSGQTCPKCAMERRRESKKERRIGLEQFSQRIAESDIGRKWKLSPDQEYIDNKTSYRIQCSECKQEVLMSVVNFAQGRRCPQRCRGGLSKGAIAVKQWLEKNQYSFQMEYSFDDCVHRRRLRFDFAVILNGKVFLIEYDGELHFHTRFNGPASSSLREVMIRDRIKNEYCEKNSIPLLRIDHTDLEDNVFADKLMGFLPR